MSPLQCDTMWHAGMPGRSLRSAIALCGVIAVQNDGLTDVKEMLRSSDPLTHRRLKGAMDVLMQNCDTYLALHASLMAGSGAGKTKLDRYRLKTCKNYVVSTGTPLYP